jgi:hypothetical protein
MAPIKGLLYGTIGSAAYLADGVVTGIAMFIGAEPIGRGVNEQESSVLREVFGESIDLNQIRIMDARESGWGSLHGWLRGDGAMVSRQRIYHDFTKADIDNSTLVHEGAHIWQEQNGNVAGHVIVEYIGNEICGGDIYEQDPVARSTSFEKLSVEHQATRIERWYTVNQGVLAAAENARFQNADPSRNDGIVEITSEDGVRSYHDKIPDPQRASEHIFFRAEHPMHPSNAAAVEQARSRQGAPR